MECPDETEKQILSFLSYLSYQRRYSKHTLNAYHQDLNQWMDFLRKSKDSTPSLPAARLFVLELLKNNYQPRTVRRKLSALKKFHRFLIKEGYEGVRGIHELSVPKIQEKVPEFLKVTEVMEIFNREKEQDDNVKINSNVNSYKLLLKNIMLQLFYWCGLRREELINLREDHVDLQQLEIKVQGKRKKQRIIPITIELKRNLANYISVKRNMGLGRDFLLVNERNRKLSPSYVYRSVREFLTKISHLKKKSPHVLRHTFATHLLMEGASIQAVSELLGHSGLSSTQVYAHVLTEKLKKAYQQAHPRSGAED